MSLESEINAVLLREAELLDDWLLDDWLTLYAADAVYWLPIDEKADPRREPSIIHEGKALLEVRVEQLMRQNRHAQSPRSEIMRLITNVQVTADGADRAQARFNLLAVETRSGDWRQNGMGQKRFYGGRCDVRLRREAGGWLIERKTIRLIDRHQPIESLSFIL